MVRFVKSKLANELHVRRKFSAGCLVMVFGLVMSCDAFGAAPTFESRAVGGVADRPSIAQNASPTKTVT